MTQAAPDFEGRANPKVTDIKRDTVDLSHIVKLLRRHFWAFALTSGGIFGITVIWTLLQTPIFEARGQLLMQQKNQTSALTGLSDKLGELSPLTSQSNPLETQAQVLLSGPVLSQTIAFLSLKNSKGQPLTVEDLRRLLKAKPVRGTDVLEVSFRDKDPVQAAKTVNALFQYYLQADIQANRSQTRSARQFIVSQLPRTEEQLRKAEAALRLFKERSRIVNLEAEGKSAVEGIAKLTESLAQAQAQYAAAQKAKAQLQQKVGVSSQEGIALGRLSESAGFQGTLRQLQQVEDQITAERATYADNHPRIIDLQERRGALQNAVQQRVGQTLGSQAGSGRSGNVQMGEFSLDLTTELVKAEVALESAAGQVTELQQFLRAFVQRSEVMPRLEQQQVQLERKVQVGQGAYQNLLKSLQDAQLAENQNIGNARVLDPAIVPLTPVLPKKLLNVALGTFLGVLAGFGVVLLLDARDRAVRTVSELQSLFGYLILGTIPLFDGSLKTNRQRQPKKDFLNSLVVRDAPRSGASEAYRGLVANLKFSRSDHALRVIVVTSCLPGEGKSTTVANVALAMNELGARVLIIDADLRRPSQHRLWERPNTVGLSNVLVDEAILNEAICIEDNRLGLMTSGVLPPSPIALLDSVRMEMILKTLRLTYDYILIDTPPLTVAADALVLSQKADGLLLVARPEVLNRSAAMRGKDLIEQAGQAVVGLVVNGVLPEHDEGDYYYYYSKNYYSDDTSLPSVSTTEGNMLKS